jgi:hypothetical protein
MFSCLRSLPKSFLDSQDHCGWTLKDLFPGGCANFVLLDTMFDVTPLIMGLELGPLFTGALDHLHFNLAMWRHAFVTNLCCC